MNNLKSQYERIASQKGSAESLMGIKVTGPAAAAAAVKVSVGKVDRPRQDSPKSIYEDHSFDHIDTDGDGVLSREEFEAMRRTRLTL